MRAGVNCPKKALLKILKPTDIKTMSSFLEAYLVYLFPIQLFMILLFPIRLFNQLHMFKHEATLSIRI